MSFGSSLALLADILIRREELEANATAMERRAISEISNLTERILDCYEILQTVIRLSTSVASKEGPSLPDTLVLRRIIDRLEDEKSAMVKSMAQYKDLVGTVRSLFNQEEDVEVTFHSILTNSGDLCDVLSQSKSKILEIQQAFIMWNCWARISVFFDLALAVVIGVVLASLWFFIF